MLRQSTNEAGSHSLEDLGWCESFARAFQALGGEGGLVPGRVVLQQRGRYDVITAAGHMPAELEARFRREAATAAELPSVGDWVAIRPGEGGAVASVCALLPRLTKFSRRAAGVEHVEQVLAANVDTVFIVMGLDGDFNLRRLERYLTVASGSGARPVLLLTKSDLCSPDDLRARIADVRAIAPEVAVLATSVLPTGALGPSADARVDGLASLDALDPYLGRGQTVVLLGSSGVGKSTLVNALLQRDVLRTGEVRPSDSRGRHTTTQRQLFRVRGGALVIDTPGIRELQLWDAQAGFARTFADVGAVAAGCRFRDCRHQDEPGCAVVAAVARGELTPERLAAFNKLKEEQKTDAAGGTRASNRRRVRR